jgi:hypothetical protein
LPENIFYGDFQAKTNIFLAYGDHDGGVCHTDQQCAHDPAYGFYLKRQYQNSN